MTRIQIIKYKGKEILYYDHRGLKGDELLNNAKAADQFMKSYKGDYPLFLADFRDAFISQEVLDHTRSKGSN